MVAHFRLATVLKHRKHLEDNAQKAFSEANRKWAQARDVLKSMVAEQHRYRQDLKTKMNGKGDAAEMLLYMRYLDRLDADVEMQTRLLNDLKNTKKEKHAELLAAVKNRKVIEKLKARCREMEMHQTRIQEQQQLNESAVSRYHARSHHKDAG